MLDYSSSFDRVPADTTDSTPSLAVSSGAADARRRHVLQYLGRFE